MKTNFLWSHNFVTTICLFACLFSSGCVTNQDIQQTKKMQEDGKRVVVPITLALREYYTDHKRYPEKIKELEPKYVKTIENEMNNNFSLNSENGKQGYFYHLENENEYTINFGFVLAGSNHCFGGARNGEETIAWSCGSAL